MRQTCFSQSRCVAWSRDLKQWLLWQQMLLSWLRTVHRPPRFRLTCLILSDPTSVVYCYFSLRFIVSECVRLSLFQINTTRPWLRLKTRLLRVNFWLEDKPRLLLIVISFLVSHVRSAEAKLKSKQFRRNSVLVFVSVLFQFHFTCKRVISFWQCVSSVTQTRSSDKLAHNGRRKYRLLPVEFELCVLILPLCYYLNHHHHHQRRHSRLYPD